MQKLYGTVLKSEDILSDVLSQNHVFGFQTVFELSQSGCSDIISHSSGSWSLQRGHQL